MHVIAWIVGYLLVGLAIFSAVYVLAEEEPEGPIFLIIPLWPIAGVVVGVLLGVEWFTAKLKKLRRKNKEKRELASLAARNVR